ncbi:hypothetical protein KVR01_013349 [Diaporthe batatas]|uniref:uncharacterized protein n=1 Tax=Diaporthe batatas TaxID=748121 RepID=UPI001D04E607|nr:uncharacterized protein KVR01_013349 [Diaporthe batatas]KAG8156744.1 hypothetical protein KVR01_013349 [Diaporthe batatas]
MAKLIERFEAWGYVVEPDAKGFEGVNYSKEEKHCNIFHPDSRRPEIPINTFSITNNPHSLKVPRAFNMSSFFDNRPRNKKLRLRDQIVSYWTLVEHRDLKDLRQIVYKGVIERNLRDCMEHVYEMHEVDQSKELTVKASDTDEAYQLLLKNTPFLAGAQKMLDEYADKFAGKKIRSCTFEPCGGFALFDFTISFTR